MALVAAIRASAAATQRRAMDIPDRGDAAIIWTGALKRLI
jgi:hypothetical protein